MKRESSPAKKRAKGCGNPVAARVITARQGERILALLDKMNRQLAALSRKAA